MTKENLTAEERKQCIQQGYICDSCDLITPHLHESSPFCYLCTDCMDKLMKEKN